MEKCKQLAKQIRMDCVRMTNSGRSGHVGSMLSMADMIAVLYEKILNVDPANPKRPDRDRFILSKGHAGAAVYSEEGQKQTNEQIAYYMNNAKVIREGLAAAGFEVYGGVNAPYIWMKTPQGMSSWDFFDDLLERLNIVGTPGSGFGPHGEGYFRLTAFGSCEKTKEAVDRIVAGKI